MKDLKDLFELIIKTKWLTKYTDIKLTGGILRHIVGKSTANDDSPGQPSETNKAKIKAGWAKFVEEGTNIIDKL